MKIFAIALLAGLTAATTAMAQGAARSAPTAVQGVYVGGSLGWGGSDFANDGQLTNTLQLGYQVTRNVAVEASFDYTYSNSNSGDNGQAAFANLILGQPLGKVTPYVLAGAGSGVNGSGNRNGDAETLWNVGGGVKYSLTNNLSLDARYRYIDAWQGEREASQVVSLGVSYKF